MEFGWYAVIIEVLISLGAWWFLMWDLKRDERRSNES